MAETSPGARARPLSPHILTWRWHITMAASIFTRVSGGAAYVGMLLLALWALALASGPDAYNTFTDLLGSIPGKVVMFGLTVALFYHLAGGLRHLAWDLGKGWDKRAASLSAWASILFAILASVGVWTAAVLTGAI
jgi:succinate dehydrogenase / fumarate reductase cytochrome b subunit